MNKRFKLLKISLKRTLSPALYQIREKLSFNMLGFNRKYCEVVTEVPVANQSWREIVLETGALQATLQDIKVSFL